MKRDRKLLMRLWKCLKLLLFGVNVKSAPYLAKGDGITDDTESIQAELDSEPLTFRWNTRWFSFKLSFRKRIFVPSGIYKISTLDVPSNTIVYGREMKSVFKFKNCDCLNVCGKNITIKNYKRKEIMKHIEG